MKVNLLLIRHRHSHFPLVIAFALTMLIAQIWSSPAFCGAIHYAARDGDTAKVQALLQDNPNLAASKDNLGETPLHWAVFSGYKGIVDLLITDKADVNATDISGETPLHDAAFGGHKDMAELLLANGANVNAKDTAGMTPLHQAVFFDRKDVAEALLAKGADVNAKDNSGETPLFYAADKDVAELLLAKGCDVNAKDNSGHTPLFVLEHKSPNDIADLLRQHGGQ